MKVFSVCGVTRSGKTTTIENIIRELRSRGYKVGSVKEIHFERFAIDALPESNTVRHRQAGSQLVTARGYNETDVLYPQKLSMEAILRHYDGFDYVVLEGVDDILVPAVVTAHGEEDLAQKLSKYAFCVSGVIANGREVAGGLPAFDSRSDVKRLVDLIESKVYDILPSFDAQCCTACGYTCATLGEKILSGEARREQCVADQGVLLEVDGKRIEMVPFVQAILRDAVLAVVKNLEGYRQGADVRIELQ